jgi:hypothetical protein
VSHDGDQLNDLHDCHELPQPSHILVGEIERRDEVMAVTEGKDKSASHEGECAMTTGSNFHEEPS